jgi:release factor glutamine methyltransferase
MTLLIGEALRQAQHSGLQRLDAQWLLAHVLSTEPAPVGHESVQPISRSWLLAHDDQALTPRQATAWHRAVQRRAAGEPLAYVMGEQLFCGLRLQVSPAVLIPRPETEGLVDWAVECLQQAALPAPRVLDLGTGSGAVALAIKHRCPTAQVWATDISQDALAVARANASRLGLPVGFALYNWWAPVLPTGEDRAAAACIASAFRLPFDLVVSNPPYIAAGDPHLGALQYEPRTALVGAAGGLGDLQTIIGGAQDHLASGAWLLLEHGHEQAPALQQQLLQAGFIEIQMRADLAGLPRCTGARRGL